MANYCPVFDNFNPENVTTIKFSYIDLPFLSSLGIFIFFFIFVSRFLRIIYLPVTHRVKGIVSRTIVKKIQRRIIRLLSIFEILLLFFHPRGRRWRESEGKYFPTVI